MTFIWKLTLLVVATTCILAQEPDSTSTSAPTTAATTASSFPGWIEGMKDRFDIIQEYLRGENFNTLCIQNVRYLYKLLSHFRVSREVL